MNKLKEETAKKNLPNDQLDDILWKVGTAIAHIQLRRSAMLDTGKDATKRVSMLSVFCNFTFKLFDV